MFQQGQGAISSRPSGDLQLTEAASPGVQRGAALQAVCCHLHGHGSAFKLNGAVVFGDAIKLKLATHSGFLVNCY